MKVPEIDVPKQPMNTNPWVGYRELQYEIKVVTPIMGGGSEANKAEECFAVRPSEIRGHLRFWWRELFAKGLEGEELRKAETAIWGDAKTPSNVRVEVSDDKAMESFEKRRNVTGPNARGAEVVKNLCGFGSTTSNEGYALFPLASQIDGCVVKEGFSFSCRIFMRIAANTNLFESKVQKQSVVIPPLSEKQCEEVKQAFAAWILLGGIGARTRRGLGCLQCDAVSNESALNKFVTFVGPASQDAMTAWKSSVELMKKFRQGENIARRPGSDPSHKNHLGRSYWPEPDSCRVMVLPRKTGHDLLDGGHLNGMGAVGKEFVSPRAALGLPIIIHFTSDHLEDVTIQIDGKNGKKDSRMASPVILKPLRLAGKWHSAFIFLKQTAEESLGPNANSVVATMGCTKVPVKILDQKNSIPKKLDVAETSDAIVALQQYVEKNGYKKIGGAK